MSLLSSIAASAIAKFLLGWWSKWQEGRKREKLGRLKEREEAQAGILRNVEKAKRAGDVVDRPGDYHDRVREKYTRDQ